MLGRADHEPVGDLIEDPWKTLPCRAEGEGCVVEFEDLDFPSSGRGAAYYVRAIQEPTPAVNGGNLRCERDATGACVSPSPCHGDDGKTDYEDDCTEPIEERAWSSPIWVDPLPPPGGHAAAG